MGVHHGDRAENASECSVSHLHFQNFPGDDIPGPSLREGRPPHAPSLSTARACATVAVTHTVTPVLGAYILRAGADPENELGGGQFRGSPSGVQGRSPGRGSRGQSPPEADDFSQLKGYLDVTSGILGEAWPS